MVTGPIRTVFENFFMYVFLMYSAFFVGFVIVIVGRSSGSSDVGFSCCVSGGSYDWSLSANCHFPIR